METGLGPFEILGIPTTANPTAIRKAYRAKAKKVHPDKNLDDPTASDKFQEIARAYLILQNSDLHFKENNCSYDDLACQQEVEPGEIFSSMFGGKACQRFVGQLKLARVASLKCGPVKPEKPKPLLLSEVAATNLELEDITCLQHELSVAQIARINTLVASMAKFLQIFVTESTPEKFKKWVAAEIKALEKAKFGREMLSTIGFMYQRMASLHLAKRSRLGLGFPCEWVSLKARMAQSGMNAVSATFALMRVQSKLKVEIENGGNKSGIRFVESRIEDIVGNLWKLNVVDVEQTLETVCEEVLSEQGISEEVLIQRARGLNLLGTMFLARATRLEKKERVKLLRESQNLSQKQSNVLKLMDHAHEENGDVNCL